MKNRFKTIASILFCLLFISSNLIAADKKKAKSEIDPNLTPENSCIFFFPMSVYLPREMIQIDPRFPHNRETIKLPKFYSTPLIPGSTYLFENVLIDAKIWDGYPIIEDSMSQSYLNFGENDTFKGYKLKVPEEPGFYYCYIETFRDENGRDDSAVVVSKTIDEEFLRRYKGTYKGFMKKFAKAYAGTEWESVINEQVEVWSK